MPASRTSAGLALLVVAALPASAYALAANEVKSKDIAKGQVRNSDLGKNAVSAPKIRKNAVRSIHLQDNGVKGTDVDEKSLDPAILQLRVSGSCGLGSAIAAIALDGQVTCNAFGLPDGEVTSAKIADGTIVAADVDATAIQRRVAPGCSAGTVVQSVAESGEPTCVSLTAPGAAGGDLTGTYPNPTIGAGKVTDAKLANPLNLTQTAGSPRVAITSATAGNIPDAASEASLKVDRTNSNSVGPAIYASTNSIFGNFGTAGVWAESKGTGGFGGLFHASNTSGNGPALVSLTDGNGNAITANAGKGGNGVETNVDGAGNALYAWVPTFGTGRAGKFNIFNENNTNPAVTVSTVGNGTALTAKVDNTNGTSPAVKGEVNSIFSNFGTAGVYGVSSGTGGFAGLFHASNPSGNGPALIAIADGNGNGITANASNGGDGLESTADGTGVSVYGWTPNFANGRAARFVNFNDSNTNAPLTVEQHSAGSIAIFKAGDPGTVNVARINAAGRGFFNDGTQVGGADVAEIVPTCSKVAAGDVVEIDPDTPDCFRLSSKANTTLVAGVVSTKPGVTLNDPTGATKASRSPALALAGRVPVKVTGNIRIGDLLVASSVPGHATRAPAHPAIGTVIGKALENFDAARGVIKMLAMTR